MPAADFLLSLYASTQSPAAFLAERLTADPVAAGSTESAAVTTLCPKCVNGEARAMHLSVADL